MRIEAVDFFYLAMPEIRDIGDGSQDALLVRVTGDNGLEGWGECEAAPPRVDCSLVLPDVPFRLQARQSCCAGQEDR